MHWQMNCRFQRRLASWLVGQTLFRLGLGLLQGRGPNRTWARQASTGGQKLRFDAFCVHAPPSLLADAPLGQLTLKAAEIATFAESVKFAECVPRGLLTRTIVARNFQTTG